MGRAQQSRHNDHERHFRDLRSDVTLDTRHIEVALRRLRAFVRGEIVRWSKVVQQAGLAATQ